MFRSTSLAVVLSTVAAATFASAAASAAPPSSRSPKTARVIKAARACAKPAVEVAAGAETATFPLTDCTGTALPAGVEELSILARPGTAVKPKEKVVVATRDKGGPDIAPGIRRIDPRLVERVELVVEHFRKDGRTPRVELVSGYRPKSTGSFHSTGRALDFKLEGVKNEDLVAFCKTLPDTGCGYYPNINSLFISRNHGRSSLTNTSTIIALDLYGHCVYT